MAGIPSLVDTHCQLLLLDLCDRLEDLPDRIADLQLVEFRRDIDILEDFFPCRIVPLGQRPIEIRDAE